MRWAPFIIMTILAVLVIAVPLLRKRRPPVSRADYDLEVYRDQLRELEADLDRGLLTKEQEEAARLEIDRRVLGLSDKPYRKSGELPRWQMALALAILVPAVSVGLYLFLGAPGIADQPIAERAVLPGEAPIPQEILDFIVTQEAHLAEVPEDGEGWLPLGRAYMFTERYREAADAFARAIELGIADADTQMERVEALFNVTGGFITPEAETAIEAALVDDPEHAGARFYQGLARSQSGRTQEAFDVWLSLAGDTPTDAPWLPYLVQALESAAEELGLDLAELMPPPAAAPPRSPLEGMTEAEQLTMIEGMVSQLAERLEQEPGDLEGWLQLSQSYRVLGRLEEARQAIDRAETLAPGDAQVLVQQASIILAVSPDGTVPPEAAAIYRRVLETEPENGEALFYSGAAHAEAGDIAAARRVWGVLLTLLDPQGGAFAQVQARIDALPAD